MLIQILLLFSKLDKDHRVRIITDVPDFHVHIDKTDIIKNEDGQLGIYRSNGRMVVINPEHIVAACTVDKGVY